MILLCDYIISIMSSGEEHSSQRVEGDVAHLQKHQAGQEGGSLQS